MAEVNQSSFEVFQAVQAALRLRQTRCANDPKFQELLQFFFFTTPITAKWHQNSFTALGVQMTTSEATYTGSEKQTAEIQ